MTAIKHQAGFVNIFGAPNAGKSTLLNALLGEHLVITSAKVQTTRHRILGILTEPNYQIVFSDTPGIIEPKYELHKKMMLQVKSALEDADIALLVHDINNDAEELKQLIQELKLKVPTMLLLNKSDTISKEEVTNQLKHYKELFPNQTVQTISAYTKSNLSKIIPFILKHLPIAEAYYPEESMSDRPTRFFVSELIREQIYSLFKEEIPYHTAVLIQSYQEKKDLHVIKADIIVSRETQKMILIGKGGSLIKQLGIQSRKSIEEFIGAKVHLELFIKVRPKWRDTENYLKEYGYH